MKENEEKVKYLTQLEMKKIFKVIEKYHFHTLKHTTAVHLAESEIDIKELQYYLGHKSVTNTLIYFQFTTKQQETMYAKLQKNNQMV